MARLARMQRKGAADDVSAAAQRKQAEKLFVRGLIDSCPRCGYEPRPGEADAESLAAWGVESIDYSTPEDLIDLTYLIKTVQ